MAKTPQIPALPGSAPLGASRPAGYSISIRGVEHRADSLDELSRAYCRARDESGEGASTFPSPNVKQAGKVVGHFSYNGRVWQGPRKNFDGESAVMLFDPRA